MNSGIYRLVFSAWHGMFVPVGECVSSRRSGKRSSARDADASASHNAWTSPWRAARFSAFAALCAFGMQPIAVVAQATLPMTPDRSGSNHPVVGVSASGVPLVNIVAPNQAGVSLNNFTHYNVGTKGIVIVNTPRRAQSQIAGWVQGNPLMGSSPARLIINQVTSGNPTRLLGMTEIAGNRANLVIANPAGITCAGCGFINTPRVSLATARPTFNADGSLAGFDVTRGRLGIAGTGLDARGSAIDLIARAMQINGEVWAGSIKATAGANQVSYADGVASAQAGEGDTPSVAIDVQALGGMYANSVHLVGTEAGVGVRSAGPINSLTGTIELSANGDLTIEASGRMQSAADAVVDVINLTNAGAIVSGNAVRLNAAETLRNAGAVAARSNVDVAAPDLTNTGDIVAGAHADGFPGRHSVTLRGINVSSSGTLAAGNNVNVTGTALSFDDGVIHAASALNLTADQSLTTRRAMVTAFNATVKSNDTFVNDEAQFHTQADMKIDARSVSNRSGNLTGQTLSAAAQDVDNTGGDLLALGRAQILTENFTNDFGRVSSLHDTLALSARRSIQCTRSRHWRRGPVG